MVLWTEQFATADKLQCRAEEPCTIKPFNTVAVFPTGESIQNFPHPVALRWQLPNFFTEQKIHRQTQSNCPKLPAANTNDL